MSVAGSAHGAPATAVPASLVSSCALASVTGALLAIATGRVIWLPSRTSPSRIAGGAAVSCIAGSPAQRSVTSIAGLAASVAASRSCAVDIPAVIARHVTVTGVGAVVATVKVDAGVTVNGPGGISPIIPAPRSRVPRLATISVSDAGVSSGSAPKSSAVGPPTSSSVAPRPVPRSGIAVVRSAVSR